MTYISDYKPGHRQMIQPVPFTRISEAAIARVQSETGMDRMQAVNHLRQRRALQGAR